MLQFLGQMIKLPLEAFVLGMEMFVKTMQGAQRIANQSVDTLTEGTDQTLTDTFSREPKVIRDVVIDVAASEEGSQTPQQTTHKEERRMPDKDLSGKDLKLVRYKILFVKRDHEHAFDEQEELLHADTDDSGFTAWKIAEFIQKLPRDAGMQDGVRIPRKWASKNYPPREYRSDGYLTGLPDEDKRFLRLYFEVLHRYPREELEYQEQQLDILRGIRDDLGGLRRGVGPAEPE